MYTSLRINRTLSRAMSLVEVLMAMVIMAIVFVVVIPQIRAIRAGWPIERDNAELLENGQALMDHIATHLTKANRIIEVSDACDSNGYIEFMDSENNIICYQIGNSEYVQYGPVDNLVALAGPVSSLRFACYDTYDLNSPISEVDYVRSVKVRATLPNSNERGRAHTFTTWAYLRTNYLAEELIVGTEYIFDNSFCHTPTLSKIDDEHFLCAYDGPSNNGCAVVLMPKYISDEWQISNGTRFIFDNSKGRTPELCQMDATHYLCAYRGPNTDGWAVVLMVDTGSWKVSNGPSFEFADNTGLPEPVEHDGDSDTTYRPALAMIDDTHYLCAYMGAGYDGWAVVLTINPSTYEISAETPFEFDGADGGAPALAKIDDTHYLCAYTGPDDDGWAVVLAVDTGSWTITKKTPFEFDTVKGGKPDLAKIDDEHYLCAYGGPDKDGWIVVLNVDLATWEISKNTPYEFDRTRGEVPELQMIDISNYVCSYEGDSGKGEGIDLPASIILRVNQLNWTICRKTPVILYSDEGDAPDIAVIDDSHFFSAFDGYPWKGHSTVLEVDLAIKP